MTLALECIEAMASVPEINTPERVMANKQRALRLLRTLRDKGPSAKAAELASEAMCAAVEGTGPWLTVEDCFRIQLDQTIREIEEER